MKNFKFWRTALSVALALTVMLSITGGTIAWFTDSVESKGNVIESGTLDIKLEYWDETAEEGSEWTEVTNNSDPLFNYGLWEPGYTDYKHVRISNTGTLALKYVLNLKAAPAAEGKADLAEVIDVYMLSGNEEVSRETLAAATPVGTLRNLMNEDDSAAHGVLLVEETADVIIALKMQESAGNDYQGLSVGDGIAIELLATQHTYEEDAFDNQYDADAVYPVDAVEVASADELLAAVAEGKSVVLKKEIVIPENATLTVAGTTMFFTEENCDVKFGNGVTLAGAGKIVLNGVDIVLSEYEHNLVVNGDIVISGSGKESLKWEQLSLVRGTGSLTLKDVNTYNDDEFYVEISNLVYDGGTHTYGALLLQESPVVTFKDGSMTFESTKGWHTYAPDIILGGNATLNIEGGEIVYDSNGDQAMTLGGYYYIPVKNVTVNITGGKIDAGPECLISIEKGENTASNTKVNISGGTFILSNGRVVQDFSSWGDAENYAKGMLTLTGGTFFTSNSTRLKNFITDGYELVGDAESGYAVSAK